MAKTLTNMGHFNPGHWVDSRCFLFETPRVNDNLENFIYSRNGSRKLSITGSASKKTVTKCRTGTDVPTP